MAKPETVKMRSCSAFTHQPSGDCVLSFRGEEDHRLIVMLDKSAADAVADELLRAGFGTGAKR